MRRLALITVLTASVVVAACQRTEPEQRTGAAASEEKHTEKKPIKITYHPWVPEKWIPEGKQIVNEGGIIRMEDKPTKPKPTNILCWMDEDGRKIYSNTVPQGKGIQPCP